MSETPSHPGERVQNFVPFFGKKPLKPIMTSPVMAYRHLISDQMVHLDMMHA